MAEIITAAHAEQAGHWYRIDGSPAYEIIGKNGNARSTTLRDARKENLVPSVTSIIRLAAAPGLDAWKADQLIMACLTLPRIMNENEQEPEADYIARIKADAKEQAKKAAEKGTEIHAQVQLGFETCSGNAFYHSANQKLYIALGVQSWIPEQPFAKDGYGGKVDLHAPGLVVDIKTTSKPLAELKTWDEHGLQLAAYRHGLGMDDARCFILYIHTETAESKLIELSANELEKGWKCFWSLKEYYRAKNNYYP
jgi:hypothetical protein